MKGRTYTFSPLPGSSGSGSPLDATSQMVAWPVHGPGVADVHVDLRVVDRANAEPEPAVDRLPVLLPLISVIFAVRGGPALRAIKLFARSITVESTARA
jgi:hypothetical protein